MNLNIDEAELQADVLSVQQIPIIKLLLDVVCNTTHMGFAAVARVTEDRWITCSANDKISFGLKPGDELNVKTTICNEIRSSQQAVIIDNVDEDKHFCQHHTPLMYGFKSYISVPIILKNGKFFGTLCAIDPAPANLDNPQIIGMFTLFSDLISLHLQAMQKVEHAELKLLREKVSRSKEIETKNEELSQINSRLEEFAFVSSHDLQEPLRKIRFYTERILDQERDNLSENGKQNLERLTRSVARMNTLIADLLTYIQIPEEGHLFQLISLDSLVENILEEYKESTFATQVIFNIGPMCQAYIIPFLIKQMLKNLVENSIKFSHPGRDTEITMNAGHIKGIDSNVEQLNKDQHYCHLEFSDNGIGFDPAYNQQIFKVFHRLNHRNDYAGTGIGLSIVKKIVDNHKGFITAGGFPGKGARFDMYFPMQN